MPSTRTASIECTPNESCLPTDRFRLTARTPVRPLGDLTDVGAYTAKPSDSAYDTFDLGGPARPGRGNLAPVHPERLRPDGGIRVRAHQALAVGERYLYELGWAVTPTPAAAPASLEQHDAAYPFGGELHTHARAAGALESWRLLQTLQASPRMQRRRRSDASCSWLPDGPTIHHTRAQERRVPSELPTFFADSRSEAYVPI